MVFCFFFLVLFSSLFFNIFVTLPKGTSIWSLELICYGFLTFSFFLSLIFSFFSKKNFFEQEGHALHSHPPWIRLWYSVVSKHGPARAEVVSGPGRNLPKKLIIKGLLRVGKKQKIQILPFWVFVKKRKAFCF